MDEYKKLSGEDVDIEKLREFVKLLQEMQTLQSRLGYLERIGRDNADLEKQLWKTADGEILIISEIPDDHLLNIISYCAERNRSVPVAIEHEVYKRNLTTVAQKSLAAGKAKRQNDDPFSDDDDFVIDKIPF